jgi:7-cyano-7-deazaguanine synthase in queuosine biosynthesis
MRRVAFRCDGAPLPRAWKDVPWDREAPINHWGPRANLNLRLQNLSHALLGQVAARADDLVRIAAYVYAADQSVSRGGPADVYGTQWRRHLAMSIPVSDPDYWNQPPVVAQLQAILSFLSEDRWEFTFVRAEPGEEQLPLAMPEREIHGAPDLIVLLSGGADSLCAAVEAVTACAAKPVLVSHRSNPQVDAHQRALVHELRHRFSNWGFPQVSVWVHRSGLDPRDVSQRTRPFLFASLGAAIGSELGVSTVLLADNGVVSLNLPISGQLVGARATRSTHPTFLRLYNRLLPDALPAHVQLSNPLWSRTRAEAFKILGAAGVPDLLLYTVSCVHRRGRTLAQPHCGICSQCVDRRFATLAAGLEEYDPQERYEVNIFRYPLAEGEARTIAESYVRFATLIQHDSPEDLFGRFPQLFECLDPADPSPDETAAALTEMVIRHGASTRAVMAAEVARASAELVNGVLPPTCLIRLAVAAAPVQPAAQELPVGSGKGGADAGSGGLRHSPDYRTVVWQGRELTLTLQQARVVQLLHEQPAQGTPEIGQAFILEHLDLTATSRLRDVFRGSPAWRTLVTQGRRKGTYRLDI